jgi:hypothetical protein
MVINPEIISRLLDVEPEPARRHPAKRLPWRMVVVGCMGVRAQVHLSAIRMP